MQLVAGVLTCFALFSRHTNSQSLSFLRGDVMQTLVILLLLFSSTQTHRTLQANKKSMGLTLPVSESQIKRESSQLKKGYVIKVEFVLCAQPTELLNIL